MTHDIERWLPQMITIPAGLFLMGTPDSQRSILAKRYGGTRESYTEESPQHEVFVETFAIARTPVTVGLYAIFQLETGAHRPITWGSDLPDAFLTHPVVDVSWHDSRAFCRWLESVTGRPFRLPTEAEWEKGARGTDGRVFPWGDTFDSHCCNTRESGVGSTTPVDQHVDGVSPFGVLDMAGNVYEWTQTLQALYPYRSDDGRNGDASLTTHQPRRLLQRLIRQSPEHAPLPVESRRIIRGGCYANPEGFARCACRLRLDPDRRTPFLGFRLACDV